MLSLTNLPEQYSLYMVISWMLGKFIIVNQLDKPETQLSHIRLYEILTH